MNLLKTLVDVVKGNAIIITLNDNKELNCVRGNNLTKTQAKLMALKIAKCLA